MSKPSWQDYGTYDESEHAWAWDNVAGLWCPSLGPTGSRLHDVSRFNNWGTLQVVTPANGWVISEGQYALDTTVTNGVGVTVDANPALDLIGGMSGACWFYPRTVTGGGYQTLFAKRVGAATPTACNYQLFLNTSNGRIGYYNLTLYVSTTVPTINAWNHAAFTRTAGGDLTLYLNGKSIHTATGVTATANAGQLTISGRPTLDQEQLNGQISEVALWRRWLSGGEIADLYSLGRGGMLQRRRRTLRRVPTQEAAFRAYWAQRQNQIIGGGV